MAVVAAGLLLKSTTALWIKVVVIAAAAYVDATVIAPRLVDEPESSPTMGGWDITYAEEGSPMKWAYGQNTRIPGQIIMAGRPWSTKSGGGGGKRAEPTQFTYWCDVIFALTANKYFRVDRIDIEGNTSYVRDVTTSFDSEFDYLTTTVTHRYRLGENESTVVWQRTGSPGSSTEWSLVQWHVTILNIDDQEAPELASFMPGEDLKVSLLDNNGNLPVGSFRLTLPYNITGQLSGSTVTVAAQQLLDNPYEGEMAFRVISSRSHGTYTIVDPTTGNERTMRRTKLVLDCLGEKGVRGFLRHELRLTGGSSGVNDKYFFDGVSTAVRDAFDPNGAHSPFNYGVAPHVWPRTSGKIRFEYDDPRQWALDVMRPDTPVAGVDYQEHVGGAQTSIDPIYEAQVGRQNVPALPQLGYFSIGGLNISRFGNRIPQMHFFTDAREREAINGVVVEKELRSTTGGDITKSGALEILLQRHGNLQPEKFDTTSKVSSTILIRGMVFGGLHEVPGLIASIALAADLHPQEWGGKIRFFTRDQRPVVNASWHMLDARQFSSPPSRILDVKDQDVRGVPKRVHLRFSDIDKDMQPGDVYAYRDSLTGRWTQNPTGDTNEVETRRVAIKDIVLSDDQARPIAERILSDSQNTRQRVRLRLPSWYQTTTEGDAIYLKDFEITPGHRGQTNPFTGATKYQNRDWWIVVEQVDIGADFYVEVEGVLWPDDPRTFELQSSAAIVGGGYGPQTEEGINRLRDYELRDKLGSNPPVTLIPVDIAPIKDADAGKTGIYFAYAAPGAHRDQPSGSLLEDVGDGDAFIDIAPATSPSIIGRVIGVLEDGPVNVQTTTQSFEVELLSTSYTSGGLFSTDDAGIAKGLNFACVGSPGAWEILQFKTVAEKAIDRSTAGDRYILSGLRRGLRGSEHYVGTHQRGEWFVLLDPRRLHFHEIDNSLVGMTRRYAVSHSTVPNSAPVEVTVEGLSSLPLRVANLKADRKSGGEVVFTWDRRTRARYRTLGTQAAPLMETTESYDVVIDLSTDRTINVSSETATYTTGQQSTDSTSGAEITVTVFQRDSVRGRGQGHQIILAQTQAEVGTEDGNVLGTENTHTLNTPRGGGMD